MLNIPSMDTYFNTFYISKYEIDHLIRQLLVLKPNHRKAMQKLPLMSNQIKVNQIAQISIQSSSNMKNLTFILS